MKQIFYLWLITTALLFVNAAYANETKEIKLQINNTVMTVNGENKNIDDSGTSPVILNNRTFVPVRAIIEAMGGKVDWNEETNTIILKMNNDEIKLVINSSIACFNGEEKQMETSPVIINGRTMLPIRFVAESFGFNVNWIDTNSTIIINKYMEETTMRDTADEEHGAAALLYQGQASIRIVTDEGKVIYVDPYAGNGYDMPADLILVTHGHFDHNGLDKIQNMNDSCKIITQNEAIKNGEHQIFDLGYVKIEPVEAGFNSLHSVKECVGYVLTFSNGKSVYVTGDTSMTEQMSKMKDMQIDYAFYCCDGVYNMGLDEAAKCAEIVGAKHNIPYHLTASSDKTYDRSLAEKFNAPNLLIVDEGKEIMIK